MPLGSGTGMLAPHGAGQGRAASASAVSWGVRRLDERSSELWLGAADEKRLGFQDDQLQLSFVRCRPLGYR